MIVLNENIIYIYLNQKKFKLNINNIKKLKIPNIYYLYLKI